MLTITAVFIDTIKILPGQERKHIDIPIKGDVCYIYKVYIVKNNLSSLY